MVPNSKQTHLQLKSINHLERKRIHICLVSNVIFGRFSPDCCVGHNSMHTLLPGLNGSKLNTNSQGRFIVNATNHITTTANLYLLLRWSNIFMSILGKAKSINLRLCHTSRQKWEVNSCHSFQRYGCQSINWCRHRDTL